MQRLCPATLESIRETVKRFAGNSLYGDVSGKLEDRLCSGRVPPMYILSSRTGIYGAAAILYPGVLKRFAESQGSDLVIIPSSIHEVLLIPLEKETDTGQLRSMVREINETELLPEETGCRIRFIFTGGKRTGLRLRTDGNTPCCIRKNVIK